MAAGRKTGGRQKGTPNKTTATLKDMILAALDEAGGQKYLLAQARTNPNAFISLLGKVLPIQNQISGADGGPVKGLIEVITGIPRAPNDKAGN